MSTLDGFLRPVPSDANPADGRLYDPTVPDVTALEATVAGPQAAQVGATAASLRISDVEAGSQQPQGGAIAAGVRMDAAAAGAQLPQAGQVQGEQDAQPVEEPVPVLVFGSRYPVPPRWALGAEVHGAQARQGGVIVAATGPAPDIEVVFDWPATPEEVEEHFVALMAMGVSAGVSRIRISRGTPELVGVGSE